MEAGRLRHRVTFQRPVEAVDAAGQPVDDWTDVATVWASVEDLRGREFFEAQQVEQSEVSTRVRVRWRGDVRADQRIRHGARTFQVVAALDPDGRKRRLDVMAQEVF